MDKSQEINEIDRIIVKASRNPKDVELLIDQYEFFILKCASETAKHYICKNDDEWAVALEAFYKAVQKYDLEKGRFIGFARLLIKRAIIDYYRSIGKFSSEVQVDSMENYTDACHRREDIKLEVEDISERLNRYGITFMDIAKCAPKATKTKAACSDILKYIFNEDSLIDEIQNSKKLPIKKIEENLGIPRKIIERHRIYIIAVAEILYGDYPYLSEYFISMRKGWRK